jgi:xylulokinase
MAVVGVDVGTSACKGIAFGAEGQRLAGARRGYVSCSPRPGWAELDAALVKQAVFEVIAGLAAQSARQGARVQAVAFSVSGDEAVPVDRAGEVLYPCITSADTRSVAQALEFEERVGTRALHELTGLPTAPNWPLIRLLWLREREPAVFARTHRFLCWEELAVSWLGLDPVTDHSLAGRTLAFDIHGRAWSPEVLAAAGIPAGMFAPSVPSGTTIGTIPRVVADTLNLPEGVAVVTGGLDATMAAFGTGATSPGAAVLSLGTWESLTVAVNEPPAAGELQRDGFAVGVHVTPQLLYYVMAANPNGAAALDWAKTLVGRTDPADTDALINEAADGPSPVLAIPDLHGSQTPWMSPHATGSLLGLRPEVTGPDLVKAVIEGTTFDMRQALHRLRAAGVGVGELRLAGGGANSSALRQLKADALGEALVPCDTPEAGCLAAAALAGAAVGMYSCPEELTTIAQAAAPPVLPRAQVAAAYQEKFEQYVAAHRRLDVHHPA